MQRRHETSSLLTQATAVQETSDYVDGRITAAIEYTRPQLFSASVSAKVHAGLAQIVQDAAASQVAAMQLRRRRLQEVSTFAWHGPQRRARAALLAWVDARIGYLQDVARSLDPLYIEHPEMQRRREEARDALLAADGTAAQVDRALPVSPPVSP